MAQTKIRRLHFGDFQQFAHTTLDFTDAAGCAQDRICLIGRNGTGKTTTLRVLDEFLGHFHEQDQGPMNAAVEYVHGGAKYICWRHGGSGRGGTARYEQEPVDVRMLLTAANGAVPMDAFPGKDAVVLSAHELVDRRLRPNHDLVVFSRAPGDVAKNEGPDIKGVPQTNVSAVTTWFRKFPWRHEISNAHITEMWRTLVYLLRKREDDRQAFETQQENLQKTKAQLLDEFERVYPPILPGLAELWDALLLPAGLTFDVDGAKLPVQLSDNLHAYIRRRDSSDEVPYRALSAGMRNLLFRVGHLHLLFRRAQPERAFVLLDEPESSLFPDFLLGLVDTYEAIVGPDTQLFVATHSPLVAAQFEPHQRVILDWDSEGFVSASKGVAPKGDDPNDVLKQDFGMGVLLGPEGQRQWRRYRALRRTARSGGGDERMAALKEAADIARRYGFVGEVQA